ncbi:hypothetical protein QVD17_01284 [Tagetes erecta]|uniref:Uncharacterized protein n=1 Tax=Tagetes erecta TaxID=13708 RepID=A0AAD8L796_TARER|nr:hypothetical protein QVD17_01284 [Tagetes erecta]
MRSEVIMVVTRGEVRRQRDGQKRLAVQVYEIWGFEKNAQCPEVFRFQKLRRKAHAMCVRRCSVYNQAWTMPCPDIIKKCRMIAGYTVEVVLKAMDDAFTIQISGNLVKQLADDSSKVKKKTRKPKPKTPKAPQQDHNKPTIHENSQPLKGVPPVAGWPPMYLPIPPPANAEVDAIRSVLQESERVLEKLEKKEDEMVVEVTQKAKELRDKEFKLPQPKPMPCLTDLTACLDCYKENTKDPLKCNALVKNFADCARTLRQ